MLVVAYDNVIMHVKKKRKMGKLSNNSAAKKLGSKHRKGLRDDVMSGYRYFKRRKLLLAPTRRRRAGSKRNSKDKRK